MSPHLVADGLVQVKGRERWTLSLHVVTTGLFMQAAWSSRLASYWRYSTTQTGRYHGRTSVRPSPLRGHSLKRSLHNSQVRDPRGPDSTC